MKRALTYVFLLLMIGETTSLNQLAKAPVLYSHYLEHSATDPSVSFFTFLSWHYWGDDANDQDDDRDMQLPFKKFEHQSPTFLYSFNNKVIPYNACWPIASDFNIERAQVYFDPAPTSLFRPPRA